MTRADAGGFDWAAEERKGAAAGGLFLALALLLVSAPMVGMLTFGFGVLPAQRLPAAWDAHHGLGTVGTFEVRTIWCSRSGCRPEGDFVSDDGTVVRGAVGLGSGANADTSGTNGDTVGQRVRAVDTGAPSRVYPVGGGHDWWGDSVSLTVMVLADLAYVVLLLAIVRSGRRRARRAQEASPT